uniref:Uncharacterized protein n=1 Tax=Rheinheimera sp. BAL341 TaxID=1708203 RepID=A0A486XR09_9GAMM
MCINRSHIGRRELLDLFERHEKQLLKPKNGVNSTPWLC